MFLVVIHYLRSRLTPRRSFPWKRKSEETHRRRCQEKGDARRLYRSLKFSSLSFPEGWLCGVPPIEPPTLSPLMLWYLHKKLVRDRRLPQLTLCDQWPLSFWYRSSSMRSSPSLGSSCFDPEGWRHHNPAGCQFRAVCHNRWTWMNVHNKVNGFSSSSIRLTLVSFSSRPSESCYA